MPFYLGALRMLHVVMGYSNATLSYSELNGQHAGEGCRSLRHILRPLWACEAKKMSCFTNIWPLTWPNQVKCWPRTKHNMQGLRHADENGGTGTRQQRNQDFLQRVIHTKNRKLSGFGPLFSCKWGDASPVPPVAEPLGSRHLMQT